MENATNSFRELKFVFSSYVNHKFKVKCDELDLVKERTGHFFYSLFSPKECFLTFVFHLKV